MNLRDYVKSKRFDYSSVREWEKETLAPFLYLADLTREANRDIEAHRAPSGPLGWLFGIQTDAGGI